MREGGREGVWCVCVCGLSLVVCKARHLKGLAWAGGVTDRPQGKVKGPLELRG